MSRFLHHRPPHAHPGSAGDGTRLADLTPGQSGVIRRILGDPGVVRRLMELGLVPGTPVQIIRHAPLGDPVELLVRGTHLSIQRSEAGRIHVEPA
jgi:ferrous iron transport protein A